MSALTATIAGIGFWTDGLPGSDAAYCPCPSRTGSGSFPSAPVTGGSQSQSSYSQPSNGGYRRYRGKA